jgi:putative copper export protein
VVLDDALRNTAFAIVRFTSFSSGALLFGIPVVLLLALRPSLTEITGEEWIDVRKRIRFRISQLVTASLIAALAAASIGLLLQTTLVAELRGGRMGQSAFDAVINTTFGRWYAVRIPLVFALAIALGGRAGKRFLAGAGDEETSPRPAFWTIWIVLGMTLLVTNSLSGHALASSPAFLTVANDLVHLSAGSVWISGIVMLAVVLPEALRRLEGEPQVKLLGPVVIRFADVALISISIVAITGVVNTLVNVAHPSDLMDSSYGLTLVTKLALFAGVLAMGGVNHFYIRRRFKRALEGSGSTRARSLFRKTIVVELALAVGLLAVTGILTGSARTRRYLDSGGVSLPQSQPAGQTHRGG